ncbi:unnamed protein product, partial [Adineta steineri]
ILFPAVALLEIVAAGYRQLFLSTDNKEQSLITLEEIKFVKALVLTQHELTEIFTQIDMLKREWSIYSRPWSSAGPDCMRPSGMASNDFIDSLLDQQTLSQHSLNEFTLHAHGRINTDNTQQKSTTILTTNMIRDTTWSTHDASSVYSHLSTRGYQYGPFKINDLSSYYLLHPSLLDACLHPLLALLPGNDTTFLPISIQKFVSSTNKNLSCSSNVEMRGNYHDNVCGLSQERTYSCDLIVLSSGDKNSPSPEEEILCSFEGLVIQQIQGARAGRWTLEKSIFDKLNAAVDLPNVDRDEHLNMILKDYCMKRTWIDSPIYI